MPRSRQRRLNIDGKPRIRIYQPQLRCMRRLLRTDLEPVQTPGLLEIKSIKPTIPIHQTITYIPSSKDNFICVLLQRKSVTSCFLNNKFVFVFQPGSGNRIKPHQFRFVLLKNHSIYPNPDQGTKIRKFGRVVYLRSTLNSLNITCNANL